MANFTDPMSYKERFTQFSGDFDNRKVIGSYDKQMYQYACIKGIPIEYYTINVDDYKEGIDVIYGENSRPKWDKKFKIVAILEDFTQEMRQYGNIMPIQNIDETQMFIHRSMFDQVIGIRSNKPIVKTVDRRGAYGPIAGDQIVTPHNGLIYEVVEGGLHFLTSEAQHFGHKFWYKVSLKSREVSDATVGSGEQYGATPDLELPDAYKGNPQYLMNSPTKEELYNNTGTVSPITVITTGSTGCENVEYVTAGTASGPPLIPPEDLIDQSGNTKSEYILQGLKEGSLFRDNEEVKKEENAIINPQTDNKVDPASEAGVKYGPNGRILPHNRKDLFKDWES